MFRNVGSKELCLSLSVISMASLIVHPVEACSRSAPNTGLREFETRRDLNDTTPPTAPLFQVGEVDEEPDLGSACTANYNCGRFAFVEIMFDEPEEEVGYLIESLGDSRLNSGLERAVSARSDGVLRLEWDISRVIDTSVSISAVDRAGNVSVARVFTLAYSP